MIKTDSIGRIFLRRSQISPDQKAIGWIEDSHVKFLTFFEYYKIIESLSFGLLELDISKGDRIAILSQTRKEWHFIDLAIMCSRSVTVPIYPSYKDEEVRYICNHSESKVLFLENTEQFKKILKQIKSYQSLKTIISIEEISSELIEDLPESIQFMSYKDVLSRGKELSHGDNNKFSNMISIADSSEIASIIYTSGTTGEPKGAVITNKAFAQMLKNVQKSFNDAYTSEDRTLTWLPLSHVFGRCDSMMPIILGWQLVFSRGMDHLIKDIEIAKPTIMMSVPRIFEKIYDKVIGKINSGSSAKKKLFEWAMKVSNDYFNRIDQDLSPTPSQILQRRIAYKTVLSKIYNSFGGKIRFFVSGGAPLSTDICRFLRNCNLTLLEGYGLTETIAPCCLNPPKKQFIGTVGVPMGDVQIKIANDGEILIKSDALFSEYYKNPEATNEALKDGWFHSGDIGEFDNQGYLKITDRKKEIIITAGGKNIAPQKIENIMKVQKYISQIIVIGDGQKYLTAVVGIEKENFSSLLGKLDLNENCKISDLATNKGVSNLIQKDINKGNKKLASFETIKKFYIAPMEISLENGLLTPSLKVKRKVVMQKFSKEIQDMCETTV